MRQKHEVLKNEAINSIAFLNFIFSNEVCEICVSEQEIIVENIEKELSNLRNTIELNKCRCIEDQEAEEHIVEYGKTEIFCLEIWNELNGVILNYPSVMDLNTKDRDEAIEHTKHLLLFGFNKAKVFNCNETIEIVLINDEFIITHLNCKEKNNEIQ